MSDRQMLECPACGNSSMHLLFHAFDRNRRTTNETFTVYVCHRCRIGTTSPQLSGDALSSVYPDVYYNLESYSDINLKSSGMYTYQMEKLAKIRTYASSGRLLDVGCGVGLFVLAAQEAGYEAEGIEMSRDAVEFGKSNFDVKLTQGNVLTNPTDGRHFDVITLWHVFEHIAEPDPALSGVRAQLTSDGILVIAVPNFSSIQARLFRSHWYHLDVPRHVFHYSPSGLVNLLARHGFDIETIDHFSLEHNWAGFVGSMFDLHSLEKESLLHKFSRKTYAYYLSHVLAWVESTMGRGGTITAIARKKE